MFEIRVRNEDGSGGERILVTVKNPFFERKERSQTENKRRRVRERTLLRAERRPGGGRNVRQRKKERSVPAVSLRCAGF